MKKFGIVIGTVVLMAVVYSPVFAHGPGWGRGHHMGYWGAGPGHCWEYREGYGNLTEEQRKGLDQLDGKFYSENLKLRDQIWTKSAELDDVLSSPQPDAERAKALQNEISELRSKMADQRLDYELEARKISPDTRMGKGFMRGYGRHERGFGPGACGY